jgi:hypothetical protein
VKVQVKGTPRSIPRKSGGSPSGVSRPPQLAATKMAKMTVWALYRRSLLVFSSGRISSIAAPVVPMNDAASPPTARKIVLLRGVARMSPFRKSPPETTNSASSSTMNCPYSTSAWTTRPGSSKSQTAAATGSPSANARPSWNDVRSHRCRVGRASGMIAMLASSATNGSMLHHGYVTSRLPPSGRA